MCTALASIETEFEIKGVDSIYILLVSTTTTTTYAHRTFVEYKHIASNRYSTFKIYFLYFPFRHFLLKVFFIMEFYNSIAHLNIEINI